MARTSKIYLCKDINVDNEYTNVLNYTVQQMLDLCTDNTHLVASASNYSFIRETENTISVGFTYGQCLQSNYIAFQNSDYSNKWFFAWIRDVKYVSDATTQITFEVDAWSTWFNDLTITNSFVIREHVNSDGYGEHTIPEGLETGEYVNMISTNWGTNLSSHIVMGTLVDPNDGESSVGSGNYGGITSGVKYYIFHYDNDLSNALTRIANKGNSDSIVSLFYCPDWITGYANADWNSNGIDEVPNTSSATQGNAIGIPLRLTQIGNYTPKNKKLFTYPYVAYVISNNSGSSVEYHLEDFHDDGTHMAKCNVYGTCCPGASIRLIPENYKKATNLADINNNEYGLTAGKFPIASYQNDAYTNWLTQNSVNIGIGTVGSIVAIGGTAMAMATGGLSLIPGAVAIASGSLGIANQMSSIYQHSFNPVHAEGNTNSGDVTYSAGFLGFSSYTMTIKEEYAKSIDEYFTRFGYKVNRLKTPNITGRQYWNFIQIGDGEELGKGAVPTKYIDIINQVSRKGVTIWHNHANIGNYNLNNSIVS